MKSIMFLITALVFHASLALAATPPEAVPGIDSKREGDLANKTALYYGSLVNKNCDESIGKVTYSATKLGSGSSMDEKQANSTITYNATYLAVSICNTGSTFSGAYRDVLSAAIVQATRKGTVKDGNSVLKPTGPDVFSVIREIDPAQLTGLQN